LDRFLLARIYLDSLDNEIKPRKIRSILKGFRKHVAESGEAQRLEVLRHAYDQAMERINEQNPSHRELAKQVLSWITCTKRPLNTAELQHALTVEAGDLTLAEDDLLQIDDMVAICAGLVTVDEESNIIRLVHFTTQEYFEQTQALWFPSAEEDISTICVTYLSFNQFESGPCQTDVDFNKRLRSNPLYDYAARNWGHHARQASKLIPDVIDFLGRRHQVEASSQVLLASRWNCQSFPRQLTPLHLVAYFGVKEVTRNLLEKTVDIDVRDTNSRTPLSWAAERGHDAIVQFLLATGKVDVDSMDSDGRTALSYAAEQGHEAIVQFLLATGKVDVDSKD
jgi:hypothetical protein